MPSWSDFRTPTHDKPAELIGRSILTSLKIPWKKYVKFLRPRWRCPECVTKPQFEEDSALPIHGSKTGHILEQMFYEVDALAWTIDAIEFRGEIHNKGKNVKHDIEREAFLSKEYGLRIHNFSNATLLKHPEEFEQYCRLLREVRMNEFTKIQSNS